VKESLSACLFNGQILHPGQLTLPELARGFMYGDGVFETLRARNFVIFRWQDHWERLVKGLRLCQIHLEKECDQIRQEIVRLLSRYQLYDAYVRVNVWRKQPDIFDPGKEEGGHLLIFARPFFPYPAADYLRGISCLVSRRFQKNENSALACVKSLNMLENILARLEAKQSGYQDAFLCNTRSYLSEATTANIFFVKNGVICTPDLESGALPGITRKIILSLCSQKNLPVQEGKFFPDQLKTASEVFLTNTLMGVMPVREVGGIFSGKNFPFAHMLQDELNHLFLEETSEQYQKNT